MTTIFETDRLTIRHWNAETDVDAAFALYGDPEVMRYLGANPQPVPNRETQAESLKKICETYNTRTDHTGFWAIVRKEDNQVLGALLFKEIPDGDQNPTGDYEIGWHLAKAYWGHGYATEAAQALLPYIAKNRPDIQTIHAIAYPENTKSLDVMQRLNMTHAGTTDKYYGISCTHYLHHISP